MHWIVKMPNGCVFEEEQYFWQRRAFSSVELAPKSIQAELQVVLGIFHQSRLLQPAINAAERS